MRAALLFSLLLLAIGCDSSDPDPASSQVEADLELELGDTANVDGLRITFEAVVTDSRCPEDVECIWAGQAAVRLLLDATPDTLAVIDPLDRFARSAQRGKVLVRAVGLHPYPGSAAAERGDTPVVYLTTEPAP